MLTFIIRRLLAGAVLVVVITTVAFFLLYAGSGNVARKILGNSATQAGVAEKNHQLGLDRPILVQFGDWLTNALHGSFGDSWFTGQPVNDAIASRLGVTLTLVIGATVITAVFAVVLGVWAATRRGWVDRIVQFLSVLGFGIPGFLIALALVLVLAINLKLFAPTGYTSFSDSPSEWIKTVTLPVIALAIGGVAGVTQQVRGSVIDALRQDYVRTLRSRGLSTTSVVFKHVLRNAGAPALAVLAVQFVGLLGGAVIVEQVFAIPGVGQVAVTATSQGDIPLVMGLVLATAVIVVIVNLVIDLAQGAINPKVRLS
ncbi:peptide/nickel transport system permease protein [Frondihabitans sp. PhB188]|uniref:ABC transporter permease n=1 Tax=Frondihabitans sp. PhB188 TaxID=2485200 RepID=UPI000F477CF4|nr:ABC transporter permease [Frondihabitans sp. PhB188]ROQ38664.1 peptide/nickel transport system permease protein [Frondihabitans sp. PhB188]